MGVFVVAWASQSDFMDHILSTVVNQPTLVAKIPVDAKTNASTPCSTNQPIFACVRHSRAV
jgi:hypothetical protein